jgi:hypothetical protein
VQTEERRGSAVAPVIALLLLAPIVGEFLFGATRISAGFVLVMQVGTWGCAALLIRHVARGRGWGRMMLLALALAVAEECVIQQTSLAPLIGAPPDHVYSRAYGVNWVYLLWALGYESVWIVLLPIQLTELIFPARREERWIGPVGAAMAGVVFVLASLAAWYSWTQVLVPKLFPQWAYSPPLSTVLVALTVIAVLIAAALVPAPERRAPTAARVPGPWAVGLLAFAFGLGWCGLVLVAYGVSPGLPPAAPMAVGLAMAGAALGLLRRWGGSVQWRDSHRCALVIGALVGSMAVGFAVLKLGAAPPVDVIGKLVLNAVAVLLLVLLARRTAARARNITDAPTPPAC